MNIYKRLVEETLLHLEEEKKTHLIATKETEDFFRPLIEKKKKILSVPRRIDPKHVEQTIVLPQKAQEESQLPSPAIKPVKAPAEIKTLMQKVHPHLSFTSEIPSDESALRIASNWKERENVQPAMLLSYSENSKEMQFLENIAQAIAMLVPAAVIDARRLDKENKWQTFLESSALCFIVASHYPKAFYRENLASSEKFLKDIPLFLIAPTSFYFKNPEAKRALWKTLKAMRHSLAKKCTMLPSS
jgi:hypothetical protein